MATVVVPVMGVFWERLVSVGVPLVVGWVALLFFFALDFLGGWSAGGGISVGGASDRGGGSSPFACFCARCSRLRSALALRLSYLARPSSGSLVCIDWGIESSSL